MKPIKFKGCEKTLGAPEDWDEEKQGPCAGLPIKIVDNHCVSCWEPTFKERLKLLFGGIIWLWVCSGQTQPSVGLAVGKEP